MSEDHEESLVPTLRFDGEHREVHLTTLAPPPYERAQRRALTPANKPYLSPWRQDAALI